MSRKRQPPSRPRSGTITLRRASRLFRLLWILRAGPRSRAVLLRRLKLDQRGFYRDLAMLRRLGIVLVLREHRYGLPMPFPQVMALLPLPDPRLTLQEAIVLARGAAPAHQRLRQRIEEITGRQP